ncbi:hypothetical protein IKQ26_08930 [bacterium]|nr:hypothetical protein [bacterium]
MSLLGGIPHLIGLSTNIAEEENDEDLTPMDKMSELQKAKAERAAEKAERERERAEEAKEKREEQARLEKEQAEREEEHEIQEKELSNDELKRYTLELRQAMKDDTDGRDTNSEQLDKLISNNEISDSDFAKIVNLYNQRYGTGEQDKLIETLDHELSGEFKNSILGKAAQRLANAAQDEIDCGNTNGAALQTLSELVHNSKFDDMSAAAKFVEAVMSADSAKSVTNVLKEKYPEYAQDSNLAENIEKSYDLYNEEDAVDIIDMYS